LIIQQQLSLFKVSIDPYQARIDAALFSSLHSFCDAGKRWRNSEIKGLTDPELKKADSWCGAFAIEFGIFGGSHPETHCHQGGADPKFWLSSISPHGKPTLRGQPLLDRVRGLLMIPYPLT
jgi:hypothetical protein